MPLSEHEQRVLEQMEQALYAEDPRFASNLKKSHHETASKRRAVVGILLALAGLGLVVAGVVLSQIWLGGLGFGAMVLGGAWVFTPRSSGPTLAAVAKDGSVTPGGSTARPRPGQSGKRGAKGTGAKGNGSFMQRMEQRWEKRRDDGPR